MKKTLFAVFASFAFAAAALAQDVVTVQTVTADGPTVDVPVFIRDTSGTPLGVDKPAGSKIQSLSIKVAYSPAAAVSSVSFSRAGITAGPSNSAADVTGNRHAKCSQTYAVGALPRSSRSARSGAEPGGPTDRTEFGRKRW